MAAPHISDELAAAKRRARTTAMAVRAACDPALGTRLAERFLAGFQLPPDSVVAGFWPLPGEVDIRPLLAALHVRGHRVLLPVTPPKGSPLTFLPWRPGDALAPGRFGTLVPAGGIEATPTIVLAPLLAFDRAGRRLGYGGGYYDRTLAALPGVAAVGCAFAAQEVDAVPAGDYDARLQAVATERGLIDCKGC